MPVNAMPQPRDPVDPEPDDTLAPEAVDQSRLTHLVGYAASRAAIAMRKVFAQQFGPLDLKVVEFSILVLVDANPQINPKRLGQALDISAPNLAVMLDRLTERGWLQRVRSTADRRAMHLHMTLAGRTLLQRAEALAATMEDPALHMLSAAERAMLIELLLKVAGARPGGTVTAPKRAKNRSTD